MATTSRSSRTSAIPLLVGVVVVVLIAVGVAVLGGGGDDAPSGFDPASYAAPTIEGTPVATGEVGVEAPYVRAPALLSEGENEAPKEGEATMIVFLAHWCQFCNAEIPVINEWLEEHGLPEGTELRAVATAIDATQPNYPPDTWLRERGWTVPTLLDVDNSINQAYGVDGYPKWVFVDADGMVVGTAGPLEVEDMARIAEELAASTG